MPIEQGVDEEQGECSVPGTSRDAPGSSGPSVASRHALCDSGHITSLLYFLLSEMVNGSEEF